MTADASSQKELRCFIGIEIPSAVKKKLAAEARNMQNDKQYADFKWVRKGNYHITLHFMGEIPLNKVVELKNALESSPLIEAPFDIELEAIKGFPESKKPKFIVAEIKSSETLTALRDAIKDRVESLGLSVDGDNFRPHISLARVRRGHTPPEVGKIMAMNDSIAIETYAVFKSTLTPEGSVYEVIGTFGKPKPKLDLSELLGVSD